MVGDGAESAAMTQQEHNVDGIEVLVEGQGPRTLVMIHGWPDTHRLWDAQVAHLKHSCRCVRFTLPGFERGRPARRVALDEMVALFLRIVDSVSPDQPVTLVLHDWGSVFGYQFAARHPQRVERIVSVDIGDVGSAVYLKSLPAKAKMMIFMYQIWLAAAWVFGGALGDRMTRTMARALRCRADPALIGWRMNYPYYLQWTGGYRASARFEPHCPVLFIYGRRKPFMFHSPHWAAKVAALPGGAVREFRTGHWVMVEQPEAFNACVAEWLQQGALSAG